MKQFITVFTVIAAILLIGCTGKQGPTGPQGEKGDDGAGTRIVYTSPNPISTNDAFTVEVPEIHLEDMPIVSVYAKMEGTALWFELPQYFKDFPDFGFACFIREGMVIFSNCKTCYYKIVVVT